MQTKGKKTKIDQRKLNQIIHLLFNERLSPRQIARTIGVSHMTIYRALNGIEVLI